MNAKIKMLTRSILVGALAMGSLALAQSGTATKMKDDSKPYVGASDKSKGTSKGTTYNNGQGATGSGAGVKGDQSAEGLQQPAKAGGSTKTTGPAKTTNP